MGSVKKFLFISFFITSFRGVSIFFVSLEYMILSTSVVTELGCEWENCKKNVSFQSY